ncbi:ArsR family transcriptional regulator [Streptomyces sp. NPDC059443]|uniref:ArsR family transcriptional regulator n=1 Tax=unclassified Streptomyces TaxID=2593676 RepID=UPI0036AE9FDF
MTETTGGPTDGDVHRALAVPSRRRLVALLREAGGALGAAELAAAAGLSVATVRHHLTALTEAGLVRASARPGRPGPGRPSLGWTAVPVPSAESGDAPYRELAGALATALAGDAGRARAAGRDWGRALAVPGAEPGERVAALAARLGFDPEPRADGRVLLHGCPYRVMARARPEVICSVHQGVLDGLLEGTGTEAVLHPFLSPGLCSVELHTDS